MAKLTLVVNSKKFSSDYFYALERKVNSLTGWSYGSFNVIGTLYSDSSNYIRIDLPTDIASKHDPKCNRIWEWLQDQNSYPNQVLS